MWRIKNTAWLLTVGMVFGCSGKLPGNLGVHQGQLAACPGSPNCVSSQAEPADHRHYIAALRYDGPLAVARERLLSVLSTQKRVRIVENSENYLHAEFSSTVMGFVDDVEFYFPEERLIHVRSASRLGYSDLGVNRNRIEGIRAAFLSAAKDPQ